MATENPNLEEIQFLFDEIASVLYEAVQSEMGNQAWKCACVKTLYPPEGVGYGGLRKYRIELPDGSLHGIHTPRETRSLIDDAWVLHRRMFSNIWYGLTITIHPDRKCDVEFNYDPDCLDKNADNFLES